MGHPTQDADPVAVMRPPGLLLADLLALRAAVAADAAATLSDWQPQITRAAFAPSAANLGAYLALRRRDLSACKTS
jgi:hypothetical protein